MNDLEERIRATLDERVKASPTRTMPPGTRRRIRSRQAGTALVALATAIAFSFAAFELFSTPSGTSRTADGDDGAVVVPTLHGSDLSPSWNDVDPPAPGAWPDATYGDLSGAYIDVTEGEEASFVVDETPIDGGEVQGEPWSLVALQQNGGAAWSAAASPGPCGELYLGSLGDDGGGSFCLRLDDMAGSPEMTSMGIVWGVGPVSAYAGVVTSRVDRVELELAAGGSRRVLLLDGPQGVSGRFLVVFVPNRARGSIVAYGRSGDVLEQLQLCAAQLEVPADAVGTCGNGVVGSSSSVVNGS